MGATAVLIMVALLPCSAKIVEESFMMQVGNADVLLSQFEAGFTSLDALGLSALGSQFKSSDNRDGYLSMLQSQVRSLALGAVPDNALPLLEKLLELLDPIFEAIINETKIDEDTHRKQHQRLVDITSEYTDSIVGLRNFSDSELTIAHAKNRTHRHCRKEESNHHANHSVCEQNETLLRQRYEGARDTLHGHAVTVGMCKDTSANAFEDLDTAKQYSDALDDAIEAQRKLREKEDRCDQYQGEWNITRKRCDNEQRDFEDQVCRYAKEVSRLNREYNVSFSTAKQTLDRDLTYWSEGIEHRMVQCKVLRKIECYTGALKDHDEAEALRKQVDVCDKTEYDTSCSKVNFTLEEAPNQTALVPRPPVACESGFGYGDMPEGAKLADDCKVKRCLIVD